MLFSFLLFFLINLLIFLFENGVGIQSYAIPFLKEKLCDYVFNVFDETRVTKFSCGFFKNKRIQPRLDKLDVLIPWFHYVFTRIQILKKIKNDVLIFWHVRWTN